MSKYLIDTNVIIDFWRGELSLSDTNLLKDASVSVITICELCYGAQKSSNRVKNREQIDEFLTDFKIGILSIDYAVAETYGDMRAILEKGGKRIEDLDLLIAATAVVNNKILVTGNIKHFKRIKDLELISP